MSGRELSPLNLNTFFFSAKGAAPIEKWETSSTVCCGRPMDGASGVPVHVEALSGALASPELPGSSSSLMYAPV